MALILETDCQSAQERRWHKRIPWELFSDRRGQFSESNPLGGKRVVAHDSAVPIEHDKWRGYFPLQVLAGLGMKVCNQVPIPTSEGSTVMPIGEPLDTVRRSGNRVHLRPMTSL